MEEYENIAKFAYWTSRQQILYKYNMVAQYLKKRTDMECDKVFTDFDDEEDM
ncbi:MAG: hypothetical protein FWG63_01555 [Defluviitaleaceae bacterium]|nr:hypothetical protein [Defluviitaleaceae bacterium]